MVDILAEGRVRTDIQDGVMTVTISRPANRNALDVETMQALRHVVGVLEVRPDIVVVLLRSDGEDIFIAGGDLRQFSTLTGLEAGESVSRTMGEIALRWELLPQLTIACIEGDAYGGGVEFALASDLRVMARTSSLFLAQAKFGLTTAWGGASRLVERLGYSRTMLLLLETGKVDAEEALGLGLVERLADAGQVEDAARLIADKAVALGADYVRGLKHVLQAARSTNSRDAAMAEETAVFKRLWASEAHELRVAAFMERWKKP